jgi:Protein of unknown function (DUF2911)
MSPLYPWAEAPARPLHESLRTRAFAEPALQGADKNVLLTFILFVLPSLLPAQYPRSQHGSVSQHIQGTEVTISYNRPVARGRELFGSLVRWDRIWHPGADSATTISFSKDVTIDGHALAAGRYSLWTIPEQPPKLWTVIFNKGVGGWHTNYPGESQDALRLTVATETGPHMETLTYYFPLVDGDSALLRLQWGTMILPMKIKVTQ